MATGQLKRLALMNSVHAIELDIIEYETAFSVSDMPYILKTFDVGHKFQSLEISIPLSKHPEGPFAMGKIGFYSHGIEQLPYGHLIPFFTLCSAPSYGIKFTVEAAILDKKVRFLTQKT
jgi:hypothetical protein